MEEFPGYFCNMGTVEDSEAHCPYDLSLTAVLTPVKVTAARRVLIASAVSVLPVTFS